MSETKKPFPALFIISICVNAILAGVLVGVWFSQDKRATHNDRPRGERTERMGGPFEESLARNALRELPSEARDEMREAFAQEWRETAPLREQMSSARETIAELLAEEPVDEDALRVAFNEIRNAEFQLRERFYTRLTNMLMSLPEEQRRDLVERSSRRFERTGPHSERGEEDGRERRPPPPDGGPFGPGFGDRPPPPMPGDEPPPPPPEELED